jgi:diguanylate cyclase (GGDEF)-like protein
MSVQQRIFIPTILTTFLVSVAIIAVSAFLFSRTMADEIQQELNSMMRIANSEVKHMLDKSYMHSLYLSVDADIINALKAGDKAALAEHSRHIYEQLDMELCFFLDSSGTVITRLHEPEGIRNDFSTSPGFIAAVNSEAYSSVESGDIILMSAMSASPVRDSDGQLLGVIMSGFRLDTEEFVDRMKETLGFEFSVYQHMRIIATTIVNNDGERITGVMAIGSILQPVIRNKTEVRGKAVIEGMNKLTVYGPLIDQNGNAVGMLFVGSLVTARADAVHSFVFAGSVISLVIFILSAFGIWKLIKYISKPIEDKLDKILYDPLTGLHNRRYLSEKLDNLVKFLSRSGGYLSIIMLDIDCFKLYNDNYGHAEGDKCLKAVADVLSRCVDRAEDFVVRYGGEEFTLVLPNTNEAGAKKIATKILDRIRARKIPHEKSNVADHVTLSLGVVTGKTLPSHNAEDYIKQADELLYLSKQNGRNRFTFKSF